MNEHPKSCFSKPLSSTIDSFKCMFHPFTAPPPKASMKYLLVNANRMIGGNTITTIAENRPL